MTDIAVTVANVAESVNAKTSRGIAGETILQGQTLYKNTSDNYRLYKALAATTTQADCVGVALNSGVVGDEILINEDDDDFTPGGALAPGVTYAVSPNNAGGFAADADAGFAAGKFKTVLMVAKSAIKAKLRIIKGGAL